MSIDEDYYKPIIVKRAFNNNYIQYESKGDKDKILTNSQYLNMIRPYLVGMINDNKNQSEWKIQLSAEINFISSKPDSDETRIMHTKSGHIEIMIGMLLKDFLNLFCRDIKKIEKKKREVHSLFLMVLICCIMILIK